MSAASPATGVSTTETAMQQRRNFALMLFVVLSMCVSMSIDQKETPEVGSFAYWLLIVPTVLLPLANLAGVSRALFGPAKLVLAFGVIAGAWHLMRGDLRAVQQLVLMVLVLGWLASERAIVATRDLAWLYLLLVFVGACIWLQSDYNVWGLLPGYTDDIEKVWRISFFPNIANTAVLSLTVIFALTRDREFAIRYLPVLLLAVYFLIFSYVRTALIALLLYIGMRWWMNARSHSPRRMFWSALLLAIGANLFIATSTFVFQYIQQFEFISRLFLRSEVDLSPEEIYAQLYRPWLWWEHFQIFLASPSLMGQGAFEFIDFMNEELNIGTTPLGTEALLTRLLATYGLPASFFIYFLISRLGIAARAKDEWACACFPSIVLVMMQWGSLFHPSDANGALLMLIMLKGSNAYLLPWDRPAIRTRAKTNEV